MIYKSISDCFFINIDATRSYLSISIYCKIYILYTVDSFFTHLRQMDLSTLISRTSPFRSLRCMVCWFFLQILINHSGSDLGLHCLHMSHKKTLGSYVLRRPEFSLRYETVLICEYTNSKKKKKNRGRGSGGPGGSGSRYNVFPFFLSNDTLLVHRPTGLDPAHFNLSGY